MYQLVVVFIYGFLKVYKLEKIQEKEEEIEEKKRKKEEKKVKKKKEENQRVDVLGEEIKLDEFRSSKVISYGLKGFDGLNVVFFKFLIKFKEFNYQVFEFLFCICNCNNYF